MKPRTKIFTYYAFNYTGLILLILNGVLISTGTPVEKAFPLSVIGCVLVVISIFFLPKKKDYEALKQQKEQDQKDNNYQKS